MQLHTHQIEMGLVIGTFGDQRVNRMEDRICYMMNQLLWATAGHHSGEEEWGVASNTWAGWVLDLLHIGWLKCVYHEPINKMSVNCQTLGSAVLQE